MLRARLKFGSAPVSGALSFCAFRSRALTWSWKSSRKSVTASDSCSEDLGFFGPP